MEEEIFGTFDGRNMITAEGKFYPVYENYASKSMLVEGDELKLILADGKMIFKQIQPVAREHYVATVEQSGRDFFAITDTRRYKLLHASATFFKLQEGQEIIITVPAENEDAEWAALESVVYQEQEA